MDYQFPRQLFPSFYNSGPPTKLMERCGGNLGSYDKIIPEFQEECGPLFSLSFTSRHHARAETWRYTEPVPIPLLSPVNTALWSWEPPDPLKFTKHMQNFFVDHSHDAFGCMSNLLDLYFNFKRGRQEKHRKGVSISMWKVRHFMENLNYKLCLRAHSNKTIKKYCILMSDIVHDIPPELLGSLLHEELTEQRKNMHFSDGATGGALAFIPFSQRDGSSSQHGCLIYPGDQTLDRLNFHRVELQHSPGNPSSVDATSNRPFSFKLKSRVRQISSASLLDECCVAVRSDNLCGVWRLNESSEPQLMQVVKTKEVATCVSVSPHLLGEVLVASKSGAAYLWSVSKGIQKVRMEDSNLYFNAKSCWRWCEFSAHPRVMVYADRTGVELSDIRMNPVSIRTLFRIRNAAGCHRGERVVLSKYLGDVHPFHHLITSQTSAYIMDERFPFVPMLKWDHLMRSPPMFCHALPGSGSRTTKVLLGSQRSQEITMLQYSGGRAEACFSQGPPQALLRPTDSPKHLPVQMPHRMETVTNILSSPAAGLTCIHKRRGDEEECVSVLQLTEAGDIFYQVIEPQQPHTDRNKATDDESASRGLPLTDSQTLASDTSSDEDVIMPTQRSSMHMFVPETQKIHSGASSNSDSDVGAERIRRLKKHKLQVVVNNDPEPVEGSGSDAGVKDGTVSKDGSSSLRQCPVKLSDTGLKTWECWLRKVFHKKHRKKLHPRQLRHKSIPTRRIVQSLKDVKTERTEDKRVKRMRRDLRACMSNRSVLLNNTVSASYVPEEKVPFSNRVDTEAWGDRLNRRLTVSWQGDNYWREWWVDALGLNREEKVRALKRKRKMEKMAKRASGKSFILSTNFTSFTSCQSELDSTGWTSEASQKAMETDNITGQERPKATPRAEISTIAQTVTPGPTPTTTPQKTKEKQSSQQTTHTPRTSILSQKLPPVSRPASQRNSKRPPKDYLSSLDAPQDDPSQSQHDGHFPDSCPTLPSASSFPSYQHPSSQRSVRVHPPQDHWSGFSQSQSQSLTLSHGRLSQASQKKKRRSQIGF